MKKKISSILLFMISTQCKIGPGAGTHANAFIPLDEDALQFVCGAKISSISTLKDFVFAGSLGIRFYDEDLSAMVLFCFPLLGNKLKMESRDYLRHCSISAQLMWELSDFSDFMAGVYVNLSCCGFAIGVALSFKFDRYEIGGAGYCIQPLKCFEFSKNENQKNLKELKYLSSPINDRINNNIESNFDAIIDIAIQQNRMSNNNFIPSDIANSYDYYGYLKEENEKKFKEKNIEISNFPNLKESLDLKIIMKSLLEVFGTSVDEATKLIEKERLEQNTDFQEILYECLVKFYDFEKNLLIYIQKNDNFEEVLEQQKKDDIYKIYPIARRRSLQEYRNYMHRLLRLVRDSVKEGVDEESILNSLRSSKNSMVFLIDDKKFHLKDCLENFDVESYFKQYINKVKGALNKEIEYEYINEEFKKDNTKDLIDQILPKFNEEINDVESDSKTQKKLIQEIKNIKNQVILGTSYEIDNSNEILKSPDLIDYVYYKLYDYMNAETNLIKENEFNESFFIMEKINNNYNKETFKLAKHNKILPFYNELAVDNFKMGVNVYPCLVETQERYIISGIIENLEENLENVTVQLEKTKKELNDQLEEKEKFSCRKENLESSLSDNRELLKTKENENEKLQKDKENLQAKIDELKDQKKNLENENKKLMQEKEEKLKKLQKELSIKKEEMDQLSNEEKDHLRNYEKTLSYEMNNLDNSKNAKIEELEVDIKNKENQIEELEQEIKSLNDSHHQNLVFELEKFEKLKKLYEKDKNNEIVEYKNEIDALKIHIESLSNKLEEYKSKDREIEELTSKIKKLKNEIQQSQNKNNELQKLDDENNNQIKELKEEIKNLRDKIKELGNKRDKLENEIQNEDTEENFVNTELQNEKNARTAEFEEEIKSLNVQLEKMEQNKDRYIKELEDKLKKQKKSIEENNINFLNDKNNEIEELKNKINELKNYEQKILDETEEYVDQTYSKKIDELETQLAHLNEEVIEKDGKISKLKKIIEKQSVQIIELQNDIEKKDMYAQELKKKISEQTNTEQKTNSIILKKKMEINESEESNSGVSDFSDTDSEVINESNFIDNIENNTDIMNIEERTFQIQDKNDLKEEKINHEYNIKNIEKKLNSFHDEIKKLKNNLNEDIFLKIFTELEDKVNSIQKQIKSFHEKGVDIETFESLKKNINCLLNDINHLKSNSTDNKIFQNLDAQVKEMKYGINHANQSLKRRIDISKEVKKLNDLILLHQPNLCFYASPETLRTLFGTINDDLIKKFEIKYLNSRSIDIVIQKLVNMGIIKYKDHVFNKEKQKFIKQANGKLISEQNLLDFMNQLINTGLIKKSNANYIERVVKQLISEGFYEQLTTSILDSLKKSYKLKSNVNIMTKNLEIMNKYKNDMLNDKNIRSTVDKIIKTFEKDLKVSFYSNILDASPSLGSLILIKLQTTLNVLEKYNNLKSEFQNEKITLDMKKNSMINKNKSFMEMTKILYNLDMHNQYIKTYLVGLILQNCNTFLKAQEIWKAFIGESMNNKKKESIVQNSSLNLLASTLVTSENFSNNEVISDICLDFLLNAGITKSALYDAINQTKLTN